MSTQASNTLARLLAEYEAAIWAPRTDQRRIDSLCVKVEQQATVEGYTNHSRLYALHTAAERVCDKPRHPRRKVAA